MARYWFPVCCSQLYAINRSAARKATLPRNGFYGESKLRGQTGFSGASIPLSAINAFLTPVGYVLFQNETGLDETPSRKI